MGHKEDLLAGAKKCLLELGYAHTTARDIVAASGTNLASIGYHYGSKEELMTLAMIELVGEWGEQVDAGIDLPAGATSAEKFEARWRHLLAVFGHDRQILLASFAAFAEVERVPRLRELIAQAQESGRLSVARDFFNIDDAALDPKVARSIGSMMLAMMTGVMSQWLLDPETMPSAEEMTTAMGAMARMFLGE